MATFNSKPGFEAKWMLTIGIWLATSGLIVAADVDTNIFAARAQAEFHRTQKQFESNTNDVTAAWEFARACFDFADFATNDDEHVTIARQGIAAAKQAIARESNSAAAHYYLSENLGQLARAETLGALKLVKEMEHELKTASKLDAHFDYAGPERTLGLLYRDAPGWPISIGSRHKALNWLKQAEKLEPAYPENHLNLLESYLKWHERSAAMRELHELDTIWPAARTNLAGPHWERDWADWSARRNEACERLGETSEPEESSKKSH
jgi:hypothetical protein